MIEKMGWRLHEKPDSLCATILKAKYYPNNDIMHMKTTPNRKDSSIWKGMLTS